MNQVIKTYLGVFLLLIMVIVGAGIIVCAADAQRAEKANSGYAAAISECDFADSIIADCKKEAEADNYKLTVKKFDNNNDGYADIAECILEYDYSLSILNSTSTSTGDTDESKHHYSRIYAV